MAFLQLDSGYYAKPSSQVEFINKSLSGNHIVKFVTYYNSMYPYCQWNEEDYDYKELRKHWETPLKNNGVRFVFETGNGGLKRTKPLYQEKAVPEGQGIIFLGEGNMSSEKDRIQCPKDGEGVGKKEWFDNTGTQSHFWVIHISKTSVFTYATDGTRIVDSYKILET